MVAALAALATALLTGATMNATGAAASDTTTASQPTAACSAPAATGSARSRGMTRAVSASTGCATSARSSSTATPPTSTASDPAVGTPPLLFHGGPVMGTKQTGPLFMTPIFWAPAGHPMDASYTSIIRRYLGDVAADSGKHTNVYSTLNEYYGTNGAIRYKMKLTKAVLDTAPLPADGCTVAANDTANIYADLTGYDACLDDSQVIAETNRVVASKDLPVDYGHIYVMFLPKHVESCFFAGSTLTSANACTINHQPSAAYCAYHNQDTGRGTVYANMPFPVYLSPVGYTCGSNARGHGIIESPNGNPDADTEISPTSHEIMEAATDPDTVTGWYDSNGYENGDECAYVYGTMSGTAGSRYNQVIHGHQYLTQEEFSNRDFALTGRGCLPYE
ncbi:hypothetical protein [Phycicoccus sp. Soil748]|uniref:hypothetical protein n=1 Tax=Phycicoccus sp. Soil748 TaxID=1736397 RepID=UPI0012E3C544|nr:hypothetical protein [Phycicoccus sp. Soil748]